MELLVILWSIFKVIGIIILAIFALILLIMALVLFSPIRYQLVGEYTEDISGKFNVKWIFGAIHIYGVFEESALQFSLRLFGYCIYGADKKQKKKSKEKRKEKQKEKMDLQQTISIRRKPNEEEETEQLQQEEIKQQKIEQKEKQEQKEEKKEETKKERNIQQSQTEYQTAQKKEKNRFKKDKKENKKKKVKKQKSEKLEKKQKKKNKEKKLDINYFLHMENKKQLLQALWLFVKRMLKGVVPKHCCIKATVGTGDPALTGYIVGAAGTVKMKWQDFQITGDFTKKTINNVLLDLKGKVVIAYLLYAVIRLIIVKPVWNMIMTLWKGYR